MVALVVSTLISIVMVAGLIWYRKRQPDDHKMTWGEAMMVSIYLFFVLFFVFGIVPHQWLTLSENELNFRADVLFDFWGLVTAKSQGGWFPFELTLRVVSDVVAALIYIVFLGIFTALWTFWQTPQEKDLTKKLTTSTYGRPLVKRG